MVAGGEGHGFGQAGFAGVVHAHQALQFGELTDHGRAEVGLGKAGGLFGGARVGIDEVGDFAGQGGDAQGAVVLAAQFVVEGYGFQAVEPLGHTGLGHAKVVFPEEAGVGQAGA